MFLAGHDRFPLSLGANSKKVEPPFFLWIFVVMTKELKNSTLTFSLCVCPPNKSPNILHAENILPK